MVFYGVLRLEVSKALYFTLCPKAGVSKASYFTLCPKAGDSKACVLRPGSQKHRKIAVS